MNEKLFLIACKDKQYPAMGNEKVSEIYFVRY